tara:strand:- start:1613 stop:1813 length:201 start_codon:yes stop_codon:yes gene_type:complete
MIDLIKKLVGDNPDQDQLNYIHQEVESLLHYLMHKDWAVQFDSELICSINLFDDCFCPNHLNGGEV